MLMSWVAVLVFFKRMGMNNCISIYNMGMGEKSVAPEKTEEENQKKIPSKSGNTLYYHYPCYWLVLVLTNIVIIYTDW